ncbi:MAG: heparinase II/III-family protein [Verrucomicrobiota bacterium]|nr:heparinase II/III-family protein [Verrucomicrobiota bacterium]
MPNTTINPVERISRRSLIKLVLLAGPVMCRPFSLLAEALPGSSAGRAPGADVLPQHPRLFYNAASLDRLRPMLAADAATHAVLKKHGDKLLAANFIPEGEAMRGVGQHASYGLPGKQMSEMGLTLGLLYHLTGDERYADKLRDALLYYAKYVRWAGQSFFHRSPPWHSELDTAEFGFGYATGYDALHGVLSDADRKTIADAMVRLAVLPILNDWVLPGVRIHSFDSMGHNWWGVCVAGAGLCALTLLGDDPRAQEWIDAMDAGFEQWFNYPGDVLQNRVATFERSGPSYESVAYNNYGVSEYLHYRLAWQNTYPGRKAAHLEPLDHIARYFLHTLYPTSKGFYAVNFNDSSLESDSTATVLLLIACGLGTPEAGRFLEVVHTHSQSALFSLLRQYPAPAPALDVPNSHVYPDMGWAMMRSSWKNDATLLAVKSGYTWNHAHADAGSFILFKGGAPLIIDSGTCSYNRPEYTTYYRQSRAHNVILFDGSGQPKDDILLGCKFPGHLHSLIDGLGLKYVYADATGPMARWFSRNYRHWLWSGEVILILDDVRAHTSGRMDWLLHYDGKCTTDSDGGVRLKNGSAEAVVKMLYPPTKLREDTGLADHDPDKSVPYLVFSPDAPAQSRQFITAICLNPDAVPKFEVLEQKDCLGVRMRTPDAVEEIYLDLRAVNSPGTINLRIGDWVTDAYLLHLKRAASGDRSVRRFFLGDGSYLRHKDRSLIESLSKLTACWSPGDSLEVFSDGASDTIQIGAERPPRSVKWNGRPATARFDRQTRLVSLHV